MSWWTILSRCCSPFHLTSTEVVQGQLPCRHEKQGGHHVSQDLLSSRASHVPQLGASALDPDPSNLSSADRVTMPLTIQCSSAVLRCMLLSFHWVHSLVQVLARGERIENLVDKTDNLRNQVQFFCQDVILVLSTLTFLSVWMACWALTQRTRVGDRVSLMLPRSNVVCLKPRFLSTQMTSSWGIAGSAQDRAGLAWATEAHRSLSTLNNTSWADVHPSLEKYNMSL